MEESKIHGWGKYEAHPLTQVFTRKKKRRLYPQITVTDAHSARREPIARPDPQLENLSYRSDFPNKDIEVPSKEVLDLIHRVGTNLAKNHPELYQTLVPSALLASGIVLQEYLLYLLKPIAEDMQQAVVNEEQIRQQLEEDKKELYKDYEDDSSENSSDWSDSSDESGENNESSSEIDDSQLNNGQK